MRNLPPRLVLDASVGVKLFLDEEHSPQVESLFEAVGGDAPLQLGVPDLFYAECANILWKYVRRSGYSEPAAIQDMADIKILNLKTVPTALLMPRALELALEWEISAYDACYLTLAEEWKAALVTADQKLIQRLKGGPAPLKWIGDLLRNNS